MGSREEEEVGRCKRVDVSVQAGSLLPQEEEEELVGRRLEETQEEESEERKWECRGEFQEE